VTGSRDAVNELGLEAGAALHTGNCKLVPRRGRRHRGTHSGTRAALVAPGEVLVSSTAKDRVAGSGTEFKHRRPHELKASLAGRVVPSDDLKTATFSRFPHTLQTSEEFGNCLRGQMENSISPPRFSRRPSRRHGSNVRPGSYNSPRGLFSDLCPGGRGVA
jgi:hypothetical protein